mmetsp:Transcript_79318/g.222671  ORF Transcript_79318/g.222671 Transcript_79318/m.222671 type:complete len:210 (+) Transcript_79318:598-1227(+)
MQAAQSRDLGAEAQLVVDVAQHVDGHVHQAPPVLAPTAVPNVTLHPPRALGARGRHGKLQQQRSECLEAQMLLLLTLERRQVPMHEVHHHQDRVLRAQRLGNAPGGGGRLDRERVDVVAAEVTHIGAQDANNQRQSLQRRERDVRRTTRRRCHQRTSLGAPVPCGEAAQDQRHYRAHGHEVRAVQGALVDLLRTRVRTQQLPQAALHRG